jgi:hypothetical protein
MNTYYASNAITLHDGCIIRVDNDGRETIIIHNGPLARTYRWADGGAWYRHVDGDYTIDNVQWRELDGLAGDICFAMRCYVIDMRLDGIDNRDEACSYADDLVAGCWTCRTLLHAEAYKAIECPECGSGDVQLLSQMSMSLDDFSNHIGERA